MSGVLLAIILLFFVGSLISSLFKACFPNIFNLRGATDLMLKVAGAKEILDILTHNNKSGIGSGEKRGDN